MKLKQLILGAVTALSLALAPVPMLVGTAAAANCGNTPAAKAVLENLDGDQVGSNCGENRVNNLFKTIVQLLSLIVGIASVIVIIYAGFKYITSGGEQGRVANAKSTLIYAVIGLAIAALAQFLIHFVLVQTNNPTGAPDCATHKNLNPPDCKK